MRNHKENLAKSFIDKMKISHEETKVKIEVDTPLVQPVSY